MTQNTTKTQIEWLLQQAVRLSACAHQETPIPSRRNKWWRLSLDKVQQAQRLFQEQKSLLTDISWQPFEERMLRTGRPVYFRATLYDETQEEDQNDTHVPWVDPLEVWEEKLQKAQEHITELQQQHQKCISAQETQYLYKQMTERSVLIEQQASEMKRLQSVIDQQKERLEWLEYDHDQMKQHADHWKTMVTETKQELRQCETRLSLATMRLEDTESTAEKIERLESQTKLYQTMWQRCVPLLTEAQRIQLHDVLGVL